MDWERKFSSILKDTEANLSRVKNKLNTTANVTWNPKTYSTPMKKSTSLSELPMSFPAKYSQNMLSQSFQQDAYGGATSTALVPYPSTQALQEQIEKQNNAIDHLTGLVHRMETDRHNYKEQIRDLRNEILQLSEKTVDRRPDPHIERRMEQMRRELLGEIQLLQSQVQISSAKGSNAHLSDTQIMSMNRDFLEIFIVMHIQSHLCIQTSLGKDQKLAFAHSKHAFRDELESNRRDLEILRSRVAKVELELASFLSGSRDVERRQDHFDRTLNSIQNKPIVPQSTLTLLNTSRHLDKLQMHELKSTLAALQAKIDHLESTATPPPTSRKLPLSPTKKPKLYIENGFASDIPVKNSRCILDDLDLSDDDSQSSDFTEFDPLAVKDDKGSRRKDIDLDTVDTDDLDIDDLDLSEDDLLSQHYDSDLEHGDLT